MISMTEVDLSGLSVSDLLKTYSRLLEELRRREIVRSSNDPAGDYSEYLFCKAFGWERQANSAAGFDAKGPDGLRYQIKGRRPTRHNSSRELSAIRKLKERPFDFLGAVLFNEDFSVARAALIPIDVVESESKRSDHVNAWKFLLKDSIWDVPSVQDVTVKLQSAVESL
jgi:hypothetical protein